MSNRNYPVPLYDEHSVAIESAFFYLNPGEVAIIQAFGFMDYKERPDTTTTLQAQQACLEMLLFKEGVLPPRQECGGAALDFNEYAGNLLAKEQVMSGGCAWTISKCDNIKLLDVPGSYRFIMNDSTAVGNARVFVRILSEVAFQRNSKLYMGEMK